MNRVPESAEKQRRRVLARLQSHGTTHANEWLDLGRAVDGGKEIKRLAARIGELQEPQYGGHRIVSAGTEARCKVYRLVDVAHIPTAKKLTPREWRSPVRCFNCHTLWPSTYAGECCGEDRLLIQITIQITIRPPAAATSEARAA